jgi:hypothetical protein
MYPRPVVLQEAEEVMSLAALRRGAGNIADSDWLQDRRIDCHSCQCRLGHQADDDDSNKCWASLLSYRKILWCGGACMRSSTIGHCLAMTMVSVVLAFCPLACVTAPNQP